MREYCYDDDYNYSDQYNKCNDYYVFICCYLYSGIEFVIG